MSLRAWACSLLILLAAAPAYAQEEPCAPEVTEDAPRRLVLEAPTGAQGVWFHLEVARCLLGRVAALSASERQLGLLEDRLRLSDERDALRAREAALATQEAEAASEALEAAVRGRREAEEALDAWHRHPALWFAVGVVVSVALGAVGIYGLSAIRI